MIDDLIALKEKLDKIWKECFRKDSSFIETMRNAFKTSINKRKDAPPELLANYVNKLVQTGAKVS